MCIRDSVCTTPRRGPDDAGRPALCAVTRTPGRLCGGGRDGDTGLRLRRRAGSRPRRPSGGRDRRDLSRRRGDRGPATLHRGAGHQDCDGPDAPGAGSGLMPRPQPVVIVPCVIILCGGTSRRLGGVDKTRESLSGTTVLDYLLDDLPPGWPVICVGEMRATTRSVQWCRESPAGGGPVAGIAAGLELIRDRGTATDPDANSDIAMPGSSAPGNAICVVVGGDMPFAATALPTLVDALNAAPGLDAVLASDPDGRTQPLLAAYRFDALRAALPPVSRGARLMAVVDALVID